MTPPLVRLVPSDAAAIERHLNGFLQRHADALARQGLGTTAALRRLCASWLLGECAESDVPRDATFFDILDACGELHVGTLWAAGNDFGFGPVLYIHDLLIAPECRRRGYASAALRLLAERAASNPSIAGLALAAMPGNLAARGLYAHLGFRPFSELSFLPLRATNGVAGCPGLHPRS